MDDKVELQKIKEHPQKFVADLNHNLDVFNQQYMYQFHLQIPKGAVQKVDYYRDHYFSYLKDSVYKSNICYLLQLIDYQLWLYKLFKPSLSLENTYFYQLQITTGIVAEAVCNCILINPCIEVDSNDRSLGRVSSQHNHIENSINTATFKTNLELLHKLSVIPQELLDEYHLIRKEIRNDVHIQNWSVRLYQELTADVFKKRLAQFRQFLEKLRDQVNLSFTVKALSQILYKGDIDSNAQYQGQIIQYSGKGFGFIESNLLEQNIFFHHSEVLNIAEKLLLNSQVNFYIRTSKKGLEAYRISSFKNS